MSGFLGDLSEKQAAVLAKFRDTVKDILKPGEDDHYLLRWLRARDFDLNKAEAMLRNSKQWREQNKVDTILQDYEPPEVFKKYYVGGLCGQDKEGSLIWMDPIGYLDWKGILMSIRKQDVITSKVWLIENFYRIFEEKTKEQGRRVDQLVVIFDLEKFGMKHLWKPGIDVFTNILSVFEDHYPETLKKAIIVNAPRIFPIAYSLLRPFLTPMTQRKVSVLGPNYKEILLQQIDPDQLPKQWGGTCVDPDGNPRCPSKIVLGGDVPESYFRQNDLMDLTGFTEASISRGSTLKLDFVIEKINTVIRWQFKTDGFDIAFGVFRRTKDQRQKASDMDVVLPSQRVNSHMVPEDGSVECRHTGTYVVRFDNTYSWARSKKLHYFIEILEPQATGLDMPKTDFSSNLAPENDADDDEVYTSF